MLRALVTTAVQEDCAAGAQPGMSQCLCLMMRAVVIVLTSVIDSPIYFKKHTTQKSMLKNNLGSLIRRNGDVVMLRLIS